MLKRWHSVKKLNRFRLAVILLAGIFCFSNFDISVSAYTQAPWARAVRLKDYTEYMKKYTYSEYKLYSDNLDPVEWKLNSATNQITTTVGLTQGYDYLEFDLPYISSFYIHNEWYTENSQYDLFYAYIHPTISLYFTFENDAGVSGGLIPQYYYAEVVSIIDGVEYILPDNTWSYISLVPFNYNQFSFKLRVRIMLNELIQAYSAYPDSILKLNASFTLNDFRYYGEFDSTVWQYRLFNNMIEGFNSMANYLSSINIGVYSVNDELVNINAFLSQFKVDLFSNMKIYFDRQHTDLTTLHTDNTTFLARFNSFWTDIITKFTSWFDRQHDDLVKLLEETTEGYDNSAGNSENDKLSGALTGMDQAEGQITDIASGNLDSFNAGDVLNFNSGMVSGLKFVKSFSESFFNASGQFEHSVSVIYVMALLSIVVGLWRFVRK